MKRQLLLFATFCVLYGPRFYVLDMMPIACLIVCMLSIGWRLVKVGTIDFESLFVLFGFSSIAAYLAFVSAFFGSYDWTGAYITLKLMFYFFSAKALFSLYFESYQSKATVFIVRDVVFATFVNGVFVWAVFLFPVIQSVAGKIIFINPSNTHWLESGFRSFDVSMGGGASASFVFFVVGWAGSVFWLELSRLGRFQVVFILVTTVILGRTGFLFSLGILGYICVFYARLYLVSFLALVAVLYKPLVEMISMDEAWFAWAFEMFINFFEHGSFSSGTGSALGRMYFFPTSTFENIFGTGNYGRSSSLPYISSDVGYVRAIWGGGGIGMLLIYLLTLYGSYSVVKRGLLSFRVCYKSMLKATGILILLVLTMNLKEFHVAARGGGVLYYLLFIIFNFRDKEYENRLRNP